MKKLFLAALPLTCSFVGFSQKLASNKVPQAVKEGYKKAHPASTATWEWEDKNYEANFTENGKAMSCVVNKQGTILETESPLPLNELPAVAKTYVNKHYKRQKPKEVAKIIKANGDINYEVNYGSGDVLFDRAGNRIQKIEKKEKD